MHLPVDVCLNMFYSNYLVCNVSILIQSPQSSFGFSFNKPKYFQFAELKKSHVGVAARLKLLMINWFLKIFLNICNSTSLFSIRHNACICREQYCLFALFLFSVSPSVPAAPLPLSFPFSITLIQTNQQTTRFLIRRGNCRCPLPQRPLEASSHAARQMAEGQTRRPSWRSVRRLRACLCRPRCQGSRACQLLRLDSAAAAAATHLQVNVFFCASASW